MLSKIERDHMRHALGLTRSETSYRNAFVTHHDGPDGIVWEALVARGLADKGKSEHCGGMTTYWVTDAGRVALTGGGRTVCNAPFPNECCATPEQCAKS